MINGNFTFITLTVSVAPSRHKDHTCLRFVVNKRLDEWVSEDRVDCERMQLPRKDSKISSLSKNSRPASPDVLSPVDPRKLNAVLKKKRSEGTEASGTVYW